MVETAGDIAFMVAATGVIAFVILYLSAVKRWWSDALGATLGAVLIAAACVLAFAVARMLDIPLPGIHWWRIGMYGGFGAAVWAGVAVFVWAQFFATRRRRKRNGALSQADSAAGRQPDPHRNRYVARDLG